MNIRSMVKRQKPKVLAVPGSAVVFARCGSAVRVFGVLVFALGLAGSGIAAAQARPVITIRGFADVGAETFTASRSFKAIFGSSTAPILGGGIEVVERHNIFVHLRASRFRETGQRVFAANRQVFELGIPATITISPVELTGGYRLGSGRLVPYAGAGAGWHRYQETSRFADEGENVRKTFTGYQLLGGAELRIARWIGTAGEVQWSSVPDALGEDSNSVGTEFGEHDLGGATFRVKIVIGR